MSTTTITETCSCGATFATTEVYAALARAAAREWRKEHKHAESVGICGDQPRGWIASPAPHCVLKAGHAGMHGADEGTWWTSPTLMDDDAQEGAQ